MSLNQIITDATIYDLCTTQYEGMTLHIAENKTGDYIGYVLNPQDYVMVGRDSDFRPVYKLKDDVHKDKDVVL